ncbi:MAG: response regulator [Eubacteriales bacterium]|nr:response regulator [Eubacteriales bacterium]
MTYGVIIVDDDAVMRMSLRMMIDWESEGFLLLGEAENGLEAQKLMQEVRPAIVITDMKMPVMNGVDFIRTLEHMPHKPSVVVLSSYDDYELVRESMKLGAVDYLLKTDLSAEKLLQTLRPLRKQPSDGKNTVHLDALRANLIKNIISRFFLSDHDLAMQLQQASVVFHGEPVWCLVLKANASMEQIRNEEEYRTICVSLIHIAEEIAQDYMDAFCAEGFTGEFYLLGTLHLSDAQAQQRIQNMAERLAKMLEQYLDILVSIGISCGKKTVQGLFDACRQAQLAARRAALEKQTFFMMYPHGESQGHSAETHYHILDDTCQLDQAILRSDIAMIHTSMQKLQHTILAAPVTVFEQQQMAADLLIHICESLRQSHQKKKVPAVTAAQRLDELSQINQPKVLQDWMEVLEATLCDGLASASTNKRNTDVTRAQAYIDIHYAEDITLPALAKQLEITPGYLSTLMKRELGMTFSEYVLHVRMEHAKQLLEQEDLHIYEVATRVGYNNQYYFNSLFKRVFGVSPGQYSKKFSQRKVLG